MERVGGGQRKVVAVGYSAGAHLAAMLVYDREQRGTRGLDGDLFSGLVSVSGPLDLSACRNHEMLDLLDKYIGDAIDIRNANPIEQVTGGEGVPVLCIHGDRDPVVEPECSSRFVDRVNRGNQGLASMLWVKGAGHFDLGGVFTGAFAESGQMWAWLERLDG